MKEIKQLTEKRKRYLNSQKVFKSPSKTQWKIYKKENLKSKKFLFNNETFQDIVEFSCGLIGTLLIFLGIILFVMTEFKMVFFSILVGIFFLASLYIINKGLPNFMKIPTKDNKFIKIDLDNKKLYHNMHRLMYVKGEFYRVWYVKYILGLDEKEFENTEKLSSTLNYHFHTLHVGRMFDSVYDNKELLEEYERVKKLISDAEEEREHWINGSSTARFLDYDEFMNILETEKTIKESMDLEDKVNQFEEYMKHKNKFKKY